MRPSWGSEKEKGISFAGLGYQTVTKRKKGYTVIWCNPLISCGAPEEIRTPDLQVRSLLLYPAELRARSTKSNLTQVTVAVKLFFKIFFEKSANLLKNFTYNFP